MSDSPIGHKVRRHRHLASYRALREIQEHSPIQDYERRNERNRIRRNRRRRESYILLKKAGRLFWNPQYSTSTTLRPQQLPGPEQPILVSFDDPDETLPEPELQQQQVVYNVYDSSDSDLPDIARDEQLLPQFLQVELLQEAIFLPEAGVFLRRLLDDSAQPPPPKMYRLGGELSSVVCWRVTSTRGIQY